MMRIAIIDNTINPKFIERNIEYYAFNDGIISKSTPSIFRYTHATQIAQILEKYLLCFAEFINISIMDNDWNPACIENLTKALRLCRELNLDYINMSIGTKKPSDLKYLSKEIDALVALGVKIVAAIDNNYYLTYPASASGVIGVVHSNILENGIYAKIDSNLLGVNYAVNSEGALYNTHFKPSNSYATPLILSALANNKAINNRKCILDIIPINRSIQSVCIVAHCNNKSEIDFIRAVSILLHDDYNFEVACIEIDRGIAYAHSKRTSFVLGAYYPNLISHIYSDLIIIIEKSRNKASLDCDLHIDWDSIGLLFTCNGDGITHRIKNNEIEVCDSLIAIFR